MHWSLAERRSDSPIGRIGRAARIVLGTALLVSAVIWADPGSWDVVLAAAVLPLVALTATIAVNFALSRREVLAPARRAWSGLQIAAGIAVLFLVIVTGIGVTFASPANGPGGLMVFVGLSMLIASAANYPGCEVLALPNLVLGRRDAIWCPIYSPIDRAEKGSDHDDRLRGGASERDRS